MVDTDASGTPEEPQEEKPKIALDVDIQSPSACERHVRVSIPRADIDRYLQEAYDELRGKAEVPGFRIGRAPRKLVESRYKEQVSEQVKGSLLMDSMVQIGEEHDFSAISEPDFNMDAIDLPDEGPLTFEFDVEVRPEFDLPDWKGLKLERPTREFTDEDVDAHLEDILRNRIAKVQPHDGPAAKGDWVVLNLTFKHDGKELSSLEAESVQVREKLSFADGEIANFGELIDGKKAGDKVQAKITISDEADNEALHGKEVDADIEVVEVKRPEIPEINADILERLGGFDSEEDLREAIQSELQRQLEYHRHRRVRDQITSLLTESANWELPPELLRRQARRELERATMELRSSGFSDQDIQAHANQLQQNILANTRQALHEHFILERIAESLKIDASEEDFEMELTMIAYRNNDSVRRVRARMEKRGQMDTLRNQIIERKVIEQIVSEAEFEEVPFQMPSRDTSGIDHVIAGLSASIPEAQQSPAEELRQPADHT